MAERDPVSIQDQLDLMLEYERRMDRRDKIRTVGSFIRGCISLLPTAIILYSFYLAYTNVDLLLQYSEQLMNKVITQAAQQTLGGMGR